MKSLYKVFRESNHSYFAETYKNRFSFESTVKLGITIKPIDQPNTYELYYIPTNEMIKKVSMIHKTSNKLNQIFNNLPDIAKDQFNFERIVDELYNTNELEGVKSTKAEIARSVKDINLDKTSKKRFHSMIKSYQALINGKVILPTEPKDIRLIYDNITEEEIDPEELPDGEIFRKEITYVLKKSGSGKVIHRGIMPEEAIIDKLDQLLHVMNDYSHIPPIIKVAIGHYYFGYIHPFYDGNGRTSRFISSLYLSDIVGHIGALSLSQGCNKFTRKYLESFETTNSLMNSGEMNGFIIVFMDIILDALKDMLAELKEKLELLTMASEKINNEQKLLNKSEERSKVLVEFMFALAQNHFFAHDKGMTIKQLSVIFSLSTSTVRVLANELLDLSLIEKEGLRPAIFFIKQQYFEG